MQPERPARHAGPGRVARDPAPAADRRRPCPRTGAARLGVAKLLAAGQVGQAPVGVRRSQPAAVAMEAPHRPGVSGQVCAAWAGGCAGLRLVPTGRCSCVDIAVRIDGFRVAITGPRSPDFEPNRASNQPALIALKQPLRLHQRLRRYAARLLYELGLRPHGVRRAVAPDLPTAEHLKTSRRAELPLSVSSVLRLEHDAGRLNACDLL